MAKMSDTVMRDKETRIRVRLTPRASCDLVTGSEQGVYRIKVKAPPLEGRANKALKDFLAGELGIPKRAVEIVSGEKSREKTVRIKGLVEEEVERALLKRRTGCRGAV